MDLINLFFSKKFKKKFFSLKDLKNEIKRYDLDIYNRIKKINDIYLIKDIFYGVGGNYSKKFVGAIEIFKFIYFKNCIGLLEYILKNKDYVEDLFSLFLYLLKNKENYKDRKFYFYISYFYDNKLKKFKNLLFEFCNINKLDIFDIFYIFFLCMK